MVLLEVNCRKHFSEKNINLIMKLVYWECLFCYTCYICTWLKIMWIVDLSWCNSARKTNQSIFALLGAHTNEFALQMTSLYSTLQSFSFNSLMRWSYIKKKYVEIFSTHNILLSELWSICIIYLGIIRNLHNVSELLKKGGKKLWA